MTFKPVPKPPKREKGTRSTNKLERVPSSKKPPKHLDRDEFELEELAAILNEAKEDNKIRTFVIYRGEEPVTGVVTKLDPNTKLIHIVDKMRIVNKVHFLDILKVSSME
ncbi:YolD-like family protein [Psychrobacillus vulpis]|uniref:YolD-like family protein n=1 Tax=Psychrobacillus vulpis TaxID=2325572 RepID=A0A544TWG7_9BACI|nr:YolD-like family protein [Psychrobacillus vulpis]TQR21780.1 YolD-like family protein [Psychrobacillus vulpis]